MMVMTPTMKLADTTTAATPPTPATPSAVTDVPADVAMVMSAMEAGRFDAGARDRRAGRRRATRASAVLRLYADAGHATVVYTRDVTGRNVGFLSRSRLPLGYGGTIELPPPHGRGGEAVPVACVLLRCTPAAGGFYDCCAAFNRQYE